VPATFPGVTFHAKGAGALEILVESLDPKAYGFQLISDMVAKMKAALILIVVADNEEQLHRLTVVVLAAVIAHYRPPCLHLLGNCILGGLFVVAVSILQLVKGGPHQLIIKTLRVQHRQLRFSVSSNERADNVVAALL
jgi:hypothetical protein